MREQLIIRHAAPEKIRKPIGDLVAGQRPRSSGCRVRIELRAVQEMWRQECGLERDLQALGRLLLDLSRLASAGLYLFYQTLQPGHLGLRRGTTPGAVRELM